MTKAVQMLETLPHHRDHLQKKPVDLDKHLNAQSLIPGFPGSSIQTYASNEICALFFLSPEAVASLCMSTLQPDTLPEGRANSLRVLGDEILPVRSVETLP